MVHAAAEILPAHTSTVTDTQAATLDIGVHTTPNVVLNQHSLTHTTAPAQTHLYACTRCYLRTTRKAEQQMLFGPLIQTEARSESTASVTQQQADAHSTTARTHLFEKRTGERPNECDQ